MSARIVRSITVKQVDKVTSVTEYGILGDVDTTEATITGRYPEAGYNLNQMSNMVIKVLEGNATIGLKEKSLTVSVGDIIHIDKETPYFYEATHVRILMICSPPWTAGQYKNIS